VKPLIVPVSVAVGPVLVGGEKIFQRVPRESEVMEDVKFEWYLLAKEFEENPSRLVVRESCAVEVRGS